jgi:ketosteroid isomerase-like protein
MSVASGESKAANRGTCTAGLRLLTEVAPAASKIRAMGADDLEIARRFRIALEAAAKSGDREALYPFLAADVEWVTAKRTLHGIDEVKEELIWGSPPENLDLEFEVAEWAELGDGRVVSDVHEVYRVKATGDFAYERKRQIELTIRDGQISRYEMRIVG